MRTNTFHHIRPPTALRSGWRRNLPVAAGAVLLVTWLLWVVWR